MAALVRQAARVNEFIVATIQFPTWEAVDGWVRQHFKYMTEPYEMILSPLLALQHIQRQGYFVGDCDDVATFQAAIYYTMGYPVKFVAIRTIVSDPNYQHVFIETSINNQYLRFDATVRSGLIHREFGRMELNV